MTKEIVKVWIGMFSFVALVTIFILSLVQEKYIFSFVSLATITYVLSKALCDLTEED